LNNTEFAYTVENVTLDVPCEDINNGSEAIINYVIEVMVEDTYYKDYDCNFWECDMSPPYHLISEKAQEYWGEWFYLTFILSIVLIAGSVLIMENRSGYPLILGGLIIISSLIFARIEWIFSFLGDGEFISFVGLFFSEAYNIFLTELVIGIVLILIGVALKFLGIGQWLNDLVSIKKKS